MLIRLLLVLANPMMWLIAAMLATGWTRFFNRGDRRKHEVAQGASISTAGLGAAFQFLSVAYRPDQAFIAKAQIQQQEKADDDDDGGPDTPIEHLHRQLRRIRRGEPVDTLVWRLE